MLIVMLGEYSKDSDRTTWGREGERRGVESRKDINIHARGQVKCGTFQQLQVGCSTSERCGQRLVER